MCVCVFVLMNVSMFVYDLSFAHPYIHIFVYVVAGIFTYIHKGRMGEEWGRGELFQSAFLFLFILPIFLIVKNLFDVNIKCVFCGEYY